MSSTLAALQPVDTTESHVVVAICLPSVPRQHRLTAKPSDMREEGGGREGPRGSHSRNAFLLNRAKKTKNQLLVQISDDTKLHERHALSTSIEHTDFALNTV